MSEIKFNTKCAAAAAAGGAVVGWGEEKKVITLRGKKKEKKTSLIHSSLVKLQHGNIRVVDVNYLVLMAHIKRN